MLCGQKHMNALATTLCGNDVDDFRYLLLDETLCPIVCVFFKQDLAFVGNKQNLGQSIIGIFLVIGIDFIDAFLLP